MGEGQVINSSLQPQSTQTCRHGEDGVSASKQGLPTPLFSLSVTPPGNKTFPALESDFSGHRLSFASES